MNKAAAVSRIARPRAGRRGAVAAWGLGSVGAVLITLALVLVGEGAPGDLAPTASVRGTVTTDFGRSDLAFDLVLQPDGKLVAAGDSSVDSRVDFALARYLPDGQLDPTFGTGGRVTVPRGSALALVLQPDGKLVAAGGAGDDFALARYLPDGSLDPSFGTGGTVTTSFGESATANALVLQPDGKLVAAGRSIVTFASDTVNFALARYLPDGRLDPSFGIGGKVTTDFGGSSLNGVLALVVQPDGKLVAAGDASVGSSADLDFALARYLPDGRLDPTFGIGGTVTTDFGGIIEDIATALVLQPDGKLVAAGHDSNGDLDFALARYLPDGRLDPTFGTGGTVTTDGGLGGILALVLQPDGKLVAAGEGEGGFALVRYLPDGRLDPTFGTGGTVTTNFGDFTFALVLQPDGKLVAAGGAGGDFALARYLPDGSLDATFGPGDLNELVAFEPIPATFHFTPDPTGCPEGFVGIFRFEARLTNTSEDSLSALVVAVVALTHGNLLQNADGGPGGVGARLTVPPQDGFSDGVLSPNEFVDVPFLICITQRRLFTFVVDVFGVVEAGAEAQARAPLVR
jgi:uncharacterized delta-60 repeat protein